LYNLWQCTSIFVGKLHYLTDTGDVTICCSTGGVDDGGDRFVAAEYDADVCHLPGDEDRDALTFKRLIPELDTSLMPTPLLAVQATRLVGGTVTIGVSVHHACRRQPLAVKLACSFFLVPTFCIPTFLNLDFHNYIRT
jgi:hypothetical protein